MIAGVLRDGMTRRIGDYLSVSMKVHGRFEDEHDEFDPARHKLALSLKQLNAFRPSFKGVEATNVNHKRQFRIYSVHSVGDEKGKNGRLVIGREFVIKGADLRPDDKALGVVLHVYETLHSVLSYDPPVLFATDNEIKCAWPEDFQRDKVLDGCGEIVVGRVERSDGKDKYVSRRVKVKLFDETV